MASRIGKYKIYALKIFTEGIMIENEQSLLD